MLKKSSSCGWQIFYCPVPMTKKLHSGFVHTFKVTGFTANLSKREKVCELSVSSTKGCIAMFVNALVTSGKDFQASHAIFFPFP